MKSSPDRSGIVNDQSAVASWMPFQFQSSSNPNGELSSSIPDLEQLFRSGVRPEFLKRTAEFAGSEHSKGNSQTPELPAVPLGKGAPVKVVNPSSGSNNVGNWQFNEFSSSYELSQPAFLGEIYETAADEILARTQAQARLQADVILRAARRQAEDILQEARLSAAQVTQDAYQKGWAAAQVQGADLIAQAQQIVNETHEWRTEILKGSEYEVVNLVQIIGRAIFGNGIALDFTALHQAFDKALSEAQPLGQLRVRANPADVETLGEIWPREQAVSHGKRIDLVPDPKIERGGCLIEGELGSVDASVKTQFSRVIEALDEEVAQSQSQKAIPFRENSVGEAAK